MKINRYILYITLPVLGIIFSVLYFKNLEEGIERVEREEWKSDKPDGFFSYFKMISAPIGEDVSGYENNYRYNEFVKAMRGVKSGVIFPWVQRGPGNIGGRTRSLIVDPDDTTYNTWFAGSVSGGLWKTTDAGKTWSVLTADLPNISISSMAMAQSAHNIIYLGTGEGYGGVGMVAGNGIYKSTDKGVTWSPLAATTVGDIFKYVNKIIIHPLSADTLITCTNKGILKSIDGGLTWINKYKGNVQDIVAKTGNFNIQYAGVNGIGIIKSTDGGDTWTLSSKGMENGLRFAVAVSPADPKRVFSCVESPLSATLIYVSYDEAANWHKYEDTEGRSFDYLGGQGWFNNVIKAHPYDPEIIYIGGVSVGKIEFGRNTSSGIPVPYRADTTGTKSFMLFINFGGSLLSGGLATGDNQEAQDLSSSDWSSVEIRFGKGKKQKAHRFTVPKGEGAGVPVEDYSYRDYVEVPFEVWDTDNNRQLMASFRDQDTNGLFNLESYDPDDDLKSREYIFVNAVAYDSVTPSTKITKAGGYTYKLLYFLWPRLPDDSTWNVSALPESKIAITYGSQKYVDGTPTVLSDYYKNTNLHVDHHELVMIKTDTVNEKFIILDANDGGLGVSYNKGTTWEQINKGYITTQFYGVAKRFGSDEYIGGMQDNGTWRSPVDKDANSTSEYAECLKGDGFEVLWHPVYKNRILGSSYNNLIQISTDNGETWNDASLGITYGDGPFVTRLSNNVNNPDLVFAVGSKGVYKHTNFATGKQEWDLVPVGSGWTLNNQTHISAHNVKVSLANYNVVWAGGAMSNKHGLKLFLSTNRGGSFVATNNYQGVEMGWISGLETHPTDPKTAYALFSMSKKPKILQTNNYGVSWKDISGFGSNDTSSNGFPDVMVYSLYVYPDNDSIIWAGTEIGLFETTDKGASWHYADNGLPAVSIWSIKSQDNQIIVATHGRGIWTLDKKWVGINNREVKTNNNAISLYPNPCRTNCNIMFSDDFTGQVQIRVYDSKGTLVFKHVEMKYENMFSGKINTENFVRGHYIVKVSSGRKSYTQKLTVIK